MANKVLVFIEQRSGEIKKASFEAAKTAADLAGKFGGEVEAVLIGDSVENAAAVGGYGVGNVIHFQNSDLADYSASAYAKIISNHANESGTDVLLFANTAMGKDLAPRVAAKLNASIVMDCVGLDYETEELIATRPVYAGKALIDVKLNNSVKVVTLRPNVFSAGEPSGDKAEVEVRQVEAPDLSDRVVEVKKSEGKMDVAEADIIVSGGRGMKGAENFNLVEDLAENLGAAVGASRAVVDAGWRPHSEQVGQTGKTVSPSLYIACGISGAIQHLAGMRSSKYIVAINKDKEAPIFQVADYGIVGDVFEVLPVLTEEIKKAKS